MFSFINFATVIVFLVTMFDDSTQLVTVPRSSPDPIAELCRALVVLKRERYHIREVFNTTHTAFLTSSLLAMMKKMM